MNRLLAKLLVPHEGNDHYPHAIRPNFLLFYLAAILTVQLVYNFTTTGQFKVLAFATNIQQNQIITLTNQQRAAAGVGAVRESSLLDQAARNKAADMFAHDYWAHVSPTGVTPWYWFDQAGYYYIYAGENLARDFDTSAGVIEGWMNSPGHRDNMLSPNYTEIGVAVVNGVLLGHETTLVVQLFGKPQFQAFASNQPSSPVRGTSPTLTPAAPVAQGAAVNLEFASGSAQANPVISNPLIAAPKEEADVAYRPSVLSLEKLSGGQKMMLAIFIPILAFFLFDALMLFRTKKITVRGHSLVHATMVAMIIVILMVGSFGVIR